MRLSILRGPAVALSTLALSAALLSGCGQKPTGGMGMGGPAQVGYVVAQTQPVALTAELTGRTSAFRVSDVRPQVGGLIQKRLFQEGAYVRAGQPLYQIDPATYRASLQSAQASLAQAKAALTTAKLKADRYKELIALNAISRQDNDDAQATYLQDVANVAAQQAAVDQARINLEYTRVLAPISGRIGKSSVTEGALVTASQTTALATIQDLDQIYVDVTQSASDLLKLKRALTGGALGQPTSAEVKLTLDDGSPYPTPGRLAFSDVTVDEGTGSVILRAVFPNPGGVLLPGLFVRATVSTGVASSGILIPQAAVSRDPKGQATVYLVGAGDKAEARVITVGQTVGDKWLVTDGLKPGDRVIVEGLQKVRPGGELKPAAIGAKG
ncbi:MAG: efflux RND transporter periplasmic adaptor subunit [Caulobacteraceae bacterium]|nr:efflux RND transporter periplasmic adaptor subunit [Caulobacteraceae bacterium]